MRGVLESVALVWERMNRMGGEMGKEEGDVGRVVSPRPQTQGRCGRVRVSLVPLIMQYQPKGLAAPLFTTE